MKIQLNIKSLDKTSLLLYHRFLKLIFKKLALKSLNFQNLPLLRKRITLLKSPHVNKKAREQFELQIHRSVVIIKNVKNASNIKFLLINRPKNLKVKIKYKF